MTGASVLGPGDKLGAHCEELGTMLVEVREAS